VACVLGKHGVDEAREILRKARIPTYGLPESAAAALRAGAWRQEWLARESGTDSSGPAEPAPSTLDLTRAERRWLSAPDTHDVLGAFGIRLLSSVSVRDADEAVKAAETLGWPVALKAVAKDVLHKSDVGGVVLGIDNPDRLEEAASAIARRVRKHHRELEGFLVQPMAPKGVEMFVGATRDPAFGPVIAFGTGGVQLELWNDIVCRLGPLSRGEARHMVDSIRGRKLLDGFRGAPSGDREALVEAILGVSRLMGALPRVLELDINPLLTLEPGRGVIALDARIRVASSLGPVLS
jgi:acetyltransferase